MNAGLTWSIAVAAIAGVILRPRKLPEALWACMGAILLVLFRQLELAQAVSAVGKGVDVYLFLTGMMLLSELARRQGVFDWLASHAVSAAGGSSMRLFTLIYAVGVLVTVFLSNDATAVVLTPAVYAAVKKAGTPALPYLLICAFIANAASFVLPISNPANLVVYGHNLPALLPWLRTFLFPSVLAIAATYFVLRHVCRKDLTSAVPTDIEAAPLSHSGITAAIGILATGVVLLVTSSLGRPLGLPTCCAAAAVALVATKLQLRVLTDVVKGVSWSVLPLVAGLFVLVEGVNEAGAQQRLRQTFQVLTSMPAWTGSLGASFGIAALSNLMNNLPSGLLAGGALESGQFPEHIRHAVLIGVDLGPNLSITGSLATVLWLIALRREGEHISAWTFLKIGALVMPPALLLATIAAL